MLRKLPGLAWAATLPLAAALLPRPYTVDRYEVTIRADLERQRLAGEVTIEFHSLAESPIPALELDAGALRIASVTDGAATQYFERKSGLLIVALTNPLMPEERRAVTVRYQAEPAGGLKFSPGQVYATAVSDWLPCNNRAGERSKLRLTLSGPPETRAAASGQLGAIRAAGGQAVTEWQLDTPAAPAWFGFALGAFSESAAEAGGVKLRALGAEAPALEPVAAAFSYLAERTGKKFPGQTYTEVFCHGDASAALAGGLALLPESSAKNPAKDADKLRMLADIAAHQWFGIQVAPKDWSDLWLSDGISAFVADAFVGGKLGKESMQRLVDRAHQAYLELRAEGKDRPLYYADWTTREEAGGPIPTDEGTWFLSLLYDLVGEAAFWQGLHQYTADRWGREASSEDFQNAFRTVKPQPPKGGPKNVTKAMNTLFDQWVYGLPRGNPK